MKKVVKQLIRKLGFEVTRYSSHHEVASASFPQDFDEASIEIIRVVQPCTMTSAERLFALMQAAEYVVKAEIPGAIVECGVWQGGSMMAVAHTLQRLGNADRDLYLFDTYEGMPKPTDADVDYSGNPAAIEFEAMQKTVDSSDWCYASIDQVRQNLASTGYDMSRVKLIKGKVEHTIPDHAPEKIAILRLDTDWYESTKHELMYLFPRLVEGGVLIIDDYGHWQGSRRATDEYFAQNNLHILLNRIDYTGRIAIKC